MEIVSIIDHGTNGILITVECHVSRGLPGVVIVGLASKAVDESKERIRAAYQNSGIPFPKKRLILNLAPADIIKKSSGLDLPMAIAICADAFKGSPERVCCFGELGLDGAVKPVRGILGKLSHAKKLGVTKVILPTANALQAQLIQDLEIYSVSNLSETIELLSTEFRSRQPIKQLSSTAQLKVNSHSEVDFSEIIGQNIPKRAIEIAVTGRHNILLSGPPGTGKSMLASAAISIMPNLTMGEIIESTQIHSLVSSNYEELVVRPPLRQPHHSASNVSIIGGGSDTKPGEISLAHNGVLFMDEFPEFSRATIESLRQPLEEGKITVARAKQVITYPASSMLIATQNPCPCGFLGSQRECICSQNDILRYHKKISGPILDRIDLHVTVDSIEHTKLLDKAKNAEQSGVILQRVTYARSRQINRQGKLNSQLGSKELKEYSLLDASAKKLFDTAAEKLYLSSRSYLRTLKVARTIADLDNSEKILIAHISEALQYRPVNPHV